MPSRSCRRRPHAPRWYQESLPDSLAKDGKLSKADLVKLVEWKLTRGKWRPRLLAFAQAANEGAVKDAFLRSFSKLRSVKNGRCSSALLKEALAPLIELKGVGPATATAIVSAVEPSVPFMSDEALMAALGHKEYTVKEAVALTEALQGKAAELSAAGERQWTARMVEKCLFADAAASRSKPKSEGAAKKKRKR